METTMKKIMLAFAYLFASVFTYAQCEILNRVSSDGSMRYYIEPFNLYQTNAKSLKGCIVTDRENYFLELHPLPFPEKPRGNKLKEDLELKLTGGEILKFKHYDTRYTDNDTVMKIMYFIPKEDIEKLMNNEISEFDIDMKEDEGVRTYVLKLHKSKLKEQLACFLKDEEERKKK